MRREGLVLATNGLQTSTKLADVHVVTDKNVWLFDCNFQGLGEFDFQELTNIVGDKRPKDLIHSL